MGKKNKIKEPKVRHVFARPVRVHKGKRKKVLNKLAKDLMYEYLYGGWNSV